MSYGWSLAADALADLRDLEPWLEEDLLDEIDRVAATPWRLRVSPHGYGSHDFDCLSAERRHTVFVRFHRDDPNQVLSIIGIAAQARRRPDADADPS